MSASLRSSVAPTLVLTGGQAVAFAATFFIPLRVYAQTRFLLAVTAIRLITIVVALPVLLPSLHLVGAALALLLALAAGKAVSLTRLGRLFGVPVSELVPWRPLAATLGAAAAGLVTSALVTGAPLPPAARLIAAVPIFGAVYGALALTLLPDSERRALLACLRWRPSQRPASVEQRSPRAASG